MTRLASMLLAAVRLLSAAGLVVLAVVWRWPLWLSVRPYLLLAVLAGAALVFAVELRRARAGTDRRWRAVGVATALLALTAEIAALQAARPPGAPPLWITADQEGGVVSRLSPPLPPQPGLATFAGACAAASPACTTAVKAPPRSHRR